MPRLTIARKLGLAFGAVVALMILVLLLAMGGLDRLGDQTEESARHVPRVQHLGEITTEIRQFRVAQLERTLADDPADREELRGEEQEVAARIDALLAEALKAADTGKERAAVKRTVVDWGRYRAATSTLATVRAQRGPGAAYTDVLDGPADGIYDALKGDIAASAKLNLADASEIAASSRSTASSTRTKILLALLAALGAAIAGGVLVTRSIRGSAREVLDRLASLHDHCSTDLEGGVRALAEGDLTREVVAVTPAIPRPGTDEMGDIARATNSIRDRMVAIIGSYNDSRQALSALVAQVAGTAEAVSSSSTQMASVSDETGQAVEEIATAVGDVARGAERQVAVIGDAQGIAQKVVSVTDRSAAEAAGTAEVAGRARSLAGQGAKAVVEATAAMASVRESAEGTTTAIRALDGKSAEIGTIVDTITGIAEQTNLLALNAAIEAARAGDQGRGFAVVADEVRKLAEESEVAARTIASLIADIQTETSRVVAVVEEGARRTEQGTEVVEEARAAFEEIGGSVEEVTSRVEGIAAAVAQIAAAAAEMTDRMSEVAGVAEHSSSSSEQVSATTQQTAASAREIASSAQNLADSAQGLHRLVAQFTVATAA